jgi:hypothetical protein
MYSNPLRSSTEIHFKGDKFQQTELGAVHLTINFTWRENWPEIVIMQKHTGSKKCLGWFIRRLEEER